MWIAALIAAALATAAVAGNAYAGTQVQNNNTRNYFKNYIRSKYGDNLSESQIDALYAQFQNEKGPFNWQDPRTYINLFGGLLGGLPGALGSWAINGIGTKAGWWPSYGYNTFDQAGLDKMMADIEKAYDELGDMPEILSADQIKEIEEDAYADIDAENRQIMDLYDQTLNRTTDALQQGLQENNAAFSDYRNQLLTNDVMNQQAIAGSTRYELDRQQRNAISRGASAAQRLVANINTQLGTQAQSAQQALNTSNALAQQLLAHRQAQSGIRQDYTSALNQYDMNRANQLSGQAERKLSYGQGKVGWAMDKNQYERDAWNERLSNYFSGNSLGEGLYRSRYGTGRNKNNSL